MLTLGILWALIAIGAYAGDVAERRSGTRVLRALVWPYGFGIVVAEAWYDLRRLRK